MRGSSSSAILRRRPETAQADGSRRLDLAGIEIVLDPWLQTLHQDDISSHFPVPGGSATPRQLETATSAHAQRRFTNKIDSQNQTVAADALGVGQDRKRCARLLRTECWRTPTRSPLMQWQRV